MVLACAFCIAAGLVVSEPGPAVGRVGPGRGAGGPGLSRRDRLEAGVRDGEGFAARVGKSSGSWLLVPYVPIFGEDLSLGEEFAVLFGPRWPLTLRDHDKSPAAGRTDGFGRGFRQARRPRIPRQPH